MQRSYIPAASYDLLLPLYDPLVKLMGGAAAHRRLIDQAQLQPGQRVLEIGCGTGNLTVALERQHPTVEVVGLDPDPKALERARAKAERHRVSLQLDRGFADELPYPNESFDRVLSALMFHHLERDVKRRTLAEIRRVLKPGGSFHLLDFGGTHDHAFIAALLRGNERARDNSTDTLLDLMRDAGFVDPEEVARQRTMFGRVFYFRASQPRNLQPAAT